MDGRSFSLAALAGWSKSNPLLERTLLEALIIHSTLKDPSIMLSGKDLFTNVQGKNVRIDFSKAGRIGLATERIVLPCLVGDKPFFAYVIEKAKDEYQVLSVLTELEYGKDIEKLARVDGLDESTLRALPGPARERGDGPRGSYAFIDITDESAKLVMEFLGKINASKLGSSLVEIIQNHSLILSNKLVFMPESIVVSEEDDTEKRAQSILAQLLAHHDTRIAVIRDFQAAYRAFLENRDSFSLAKVAPALISVVSDIEISAGNEGFLMFEENAYSRTMDLSPIGLEVCGFVKLDIKDIFQEIIKYEVARKKGVNVSDLDEAFVKETLSKYDVVFEEKNMSEGVLPTMSLYEDKEGGKITLKVNGNFVRLMFMISGDREHGATLRRGIHTEAGMVKDFNDKNFIGELYNSILYSAIIHEVRGHLRVDEDGFFNFNYDELWAQGERGRGHLYVNTLAMMFYWLVVLERETYPEVRAQLLMEEHPELVRHLSDEEKFRLPEHLGAFCVELEQRGVLPFLLRYTATAASRDTYEKKMKAYYAQSETESLQIFGREKTSPLDIYKFLSNQSLPLSWRDIKDITGKSGVDPVYAYKSLSMLVGFGLVDVIEFDKATGQKESFPKYKIRPVSGRLFRDIADMLKPVNIRDMNDVVNEDEAAERVDAIRKAKAGIFELVETMRADEYLESVSFRALPEGAKEESKEIILAIDTDWIPSEQKTLIHSLVQELEKINKHSKVVVVRGTGTGLAAAIQVAMSDYHIPEKNVILLGGKYILDEPRFKFLRSGVGLDNRALLVAVDPKNLKKDSYIRLMEMLTMVLRMSKSGDLAVQHPQIQVDKIDARTYIFIPKPSPIDFSAAKRIYEAQKTVLEMA